MRNVLEIMKLYQPKIKRNALRMTTRRFCSRSRFILSFFAFFIIFFFFAFFIIFFFFFNFKLDLKWICFTLLLFHYASQWRGIQALKLLIMKLRRCSCVMLWHQTKPICYQKTETKKKLRTEKAHNFIKLMRKYWNVRSNHKINHTKHCVHGKQCKMIFIGCCWFTL